LIEVLSDLVHSPAQTGQKAAPMDAAAAQRTVAERWPKLVLDATTYVNTRRFAIWICRVHAEEGQGSMRTLSAMTRIPARLAMRSNSAGQGAPSARTRTPRENRGQTTVFLFLR
jgi:hypothetical protein